MPLASYESFLGEKYIYINQIKWKIYYSSTNKK
jgi:hypothetical protein